MNENEQILDFASALNELNKVVDSFKFDIWIPSLGSYQTFKPLDGKQQKEILGAAVNVSVYNSSFIKAFYNIIKENIVCDNKSIIDSFNLIDKAAIALGLRSKISNKLNIFFDEKKEIVRDIDIQPIIDGFKSYTPPKDLIFTTNNEEYNLQVIVSYPTIKKEYDYDNQFKVDKKPDDIKTTEDVEKIVTNAFIGETCKYIKSISINSQEIGFDNLTAEQKTKLIEKLPSSLIQKVVDQITVWKTELDKILTVSVNNAKQVISIDSVLFLN
jgi:hypothetical protein